MLRAHSRQFVIAPVPVSVDEWWTSVAIGEGLYLSHHQALPVAETRDRDGGVWYLLGIAVQTDPVRAAPLEEIATARAHEVDVLPSTWSGRWVLVGGGALRTDAGGLFGCFYARDPGDGNLLVSSSAALLHDQLGGDPSPPLRYRTGMEWYPPPASRFAGIRRLLPSQTLALSDDHPVRHRPLVGHRVEAAYDNTLGHLETSLRTALRNVAGTRRPLWLSLTGGYDTRVLLAAMWRERLDFTTFTWDISGMSSADRVLPPLLARDAGVPHLFIERQQQFDEEKLRRLDEHTALHTVDRDRELIPWGQYDHFPVDVIVIQGNLFTLGALYFHWKLPARPDTVAESIEHAFGFAEHHADSPAHRDGIREWAAWIEAHPEPAMDWRDRFFWEQWGSGWGAPCEQGADLTEVECMSPVSCESVMAAILRIDRAKRYGKRWQVDLAYRMAPFVTDHPYHLGGPLVARFRREASGWVHHPSKRRFATGRMRSLAGRMRSTRPFA